MADQSISSLVADLRRELADKSQQLSELDVMLADYQAEHGRLIHQLRALQARLDELLEQRPAHPKSQSGKEINPP